MKSYVPKKGKSRMYARPAGRPRVMRKPAKCSYVRTKQTTPRHTFDADRIKPTQTVYSLMKMRDWEMNAMLRTMKLMKTKNAVSRRCLVCGGVFGKSGRCWNRSCSERGRRADAQHADDSNYVISTHHSASDVTMQAIAALCCTVGVQAGQCHLLTGADHKLVERIYTSLRHAVALKVSELQKLICLNSTRVWVDCEADEVTLSKRCVGKGMVKWSQYLGVMRRGCPETLILIKMRDRTTIARAPGPGPLRTEEWLEVGRPILEGKYVILHTDSAKAYAVAFNKMEHARVVHMKKKVAGKWLEPKYVETVEVHTSSGVVTCKAGTQFID
eukprot:530839-Amphidinium_carterae.1